MFEVDAVGVGLASQEGALRLDTGAGALPIPDGAVARVVRPRATLAAVRRAAPVRDRGAGRPIQQMPKVASPRAFQGQKGMVAALLEATPLARVL